MITQEEDDELGLVDLTPENGIERHASRWMTLLPGTHVAVKRGAIYHHGIISEGGNVVHFAGTTFENAVICHGTGEDFLLQNVTFFEIQYKDDSEEQRQQAMQRANALRDHLELTPRMYNLFNCNRETFAVLCKIGIPRFREFIPLTIPFIFTSRSTNASSFKRC